MRQAILYTLLVLLSACGSKTTTEGWTSATESTEVDLTPAQMKNAGIETGMAQQKNVTSVLRLNGKIDVPPQNVVSVSAPLGGYLKSTNLLPGMHVSKGEVIAIMEDQQYIQLQQDYLTAKARIVYLENEYKRQRDLNKDKASSDKAYQQAEADYNSQRVLLTSLAEKLKLAGFNINNITADHITRYVNIYSPINGYVSKVDVNIGKYVTPTEVLFELINPSDIHLALKVFEKDLNKLYIGQKVVAFTNNDPQKKYNGAVILISKDLSPDRNAEVHCHFENYDKSLVPGTYMNAEVSVNSTNAAVLPADAVVSYEGKQYVFKALGNGKFDMVGVQTGETNDGEIEVKLPEAETKRRFVVKGAYSLLMAMKNKAE